MSTPPEPSVSSSAGELVSEPPLPKRALRLAALLWGIQISSLNPMTALLLVDLYGASTSQVATTLFLTNILGFFWAWFIPRQADRRRQYLIPVMASGLCAIAMMSLLASVHAVNLAMMIFVVLAGPVGFGNAMVFAYARHIGAPPSEIVTIRSFTSLGWIIGPPAATVLLSGIGGRAVLILIATMAGVNVVVAGYLHRRHLLIQSVPKQRGPIGKGVNRFGVVTMFAGFSLMQASMMSAMTVTTLYATKVLHTSSLWGGLSLSLAAGLEVPVLLRLRKMSDRGEEFKLLNTGVAVGVIYYLVMAVAVSGPMMLAAQVLNAFYVAVLLATGLTLFQRIMGLPGAAAGLQSNTARVAALLMGPFIGIGANHWIGLRGVFVTCAVSAVIGASLVMLSRNSVEARLRGATT